MKEVPVLLQQGFDLLSIGGGGFGSTDDFGGWDYGKESSVGQEL